MVGYHDDWMAAWIRSTRNLKGWLPPSSVRIFSVYCDEPDVAAAGLATAAATGTELQHLARKHTRKPAGLQALSHSESWFE